MIITLPSYQSNWTAFCNISGLHKALPVRQTLWVGTRILCNCVIQLLSSHVTMLLHSITIFTVTVHYKGFKKKLRFARPPLFPHTFLLARWQEDNGQSLSLAGNCAINQTLMWPDLYVVFKSRLCCHAIVLTALGYSRKNPNHFFHKGLMHLSPMFLCKKWEWI